MIRWRETEIGPGGERKRALRYETLGEMSRRKASDILAQRLAAAGNTNARMRSHVTFRTIATEWEATVLRDVQSVNAEAPSVHAQEASVTAVW